METRTAQLEVCWVEGVGRVVAVKVTEGRERRARREMGRKERDGRRMIVTRRWR